MPLTIQLTITPLGAPILDDPDAIVRLAAENARAAEGTPIAITIPKIHWDQKGLHYDTRNNNAEYRFNSGILQLTLRQEIHIANSLSPCARTIWLQHESGHVQDNELLMHRMDPELRANPEFAFYLITPTWQNVTLFASMETTISEVIVETFNRLTSSAVSRRDTRREYQSVERQIRLRCGQLIGRRLKLNDYGNGIDMVQVALNNKPPTQLPQLKVDGVFGRKTDARVREFQQNQRLTVDGIVGSDTRTALGL